MHDSEGNTCIAYELHTPIGQAHGGFNAVVQLAIIGSIQHWYPSPTLLTYIAPHLPLKYCHACNAGVQNGKVAGEQGLLMALSEALFSIPRVRLAVQALAATSRPQASSRLVSALQGVFAAMSKAPPIDQIVHLANLSSCSLSRKACSCSRCV